LEAISRVAAPCSSTAEAIVVAISLICRIVALMLWIASTVWPVAPWMSPICERISSVAFAV
jgi:hypothetical protein